MEGGAYINVNIAGGALGGTYGKQFVPKEAPRQIVFMPGQSSDEFRMQSQQIYLTILSETGISIGDADRQLLAGDTLVLYSR